MLRIKIQAKPSAQPPVEVKPPSQDKGGSSDDSHKTTQTISGYMGPEQAPNGFKCEYCLHFEEPGSCNIVAGPISPDGCCNLFESDADEDPSQDPDQDENPQE